MTGMPPAMALGTNKLQAFGGALSASIYFLRKRAVNLSEFSFILLVIFIGSVIGTLLIQNLDASLIKKGLPFLILAIGLYFLFTPKLGESDRKQRISYGVFALCFGSLLGFYDGFFGPGTGSLMNLACVTLLGFNLTKATAHAKVMNLTSNFASLIFFFIGGACHLDRRFSDDGRKPDRCKFRCQNGDGKRQTTDQTDGGDYVIYHDDKNGV